MYSLAKPFSILFFERRSRAMTQPSRKPQNTVISEIRMVVRVPRRKYW